MNLEQDVIGSVHSALAECIKKKLEGYGSPLDPFIKASVDKHEGEIRSVLDASVSAALKGDFAEALKDACTRKLAKVLISKMEGEIEKRANELRADSEFRARLTIAITEVVKGIRP